MKLIAAAALGVASALPMLAAAEGDVTAIACACSRVRRHHPDGTHALAVDGH